MQTFHLFCARTHTHTHKSYFLYFTPIFTKHPQAMIQSIHAIATRSKWWRHDPVDFELLCLRLIFYFCGWFLIFCLWECFADGEERERKWVKLEIIKILNARTTITMMWVFFLLKMCKISYFFYFATLYTYWC